MTIINPLLEFVHIGHSGKTRGLDGSFKLRVEERFLDSLSDIRAIFVDHDGSKVPYLIESCSNQGDILIKLEEIDSPEQASALLNRSIYLNKDELPESIRESDNNENHELVDFLIIDEDNTRIGIISEILEYPEQLLAKVIYQDKTVLIPIHNDLILGTDAEKKTIQMSLPEGLLSL